jgi:hypothetical protein
VDIRTEVMQEALLLAGLADKMHDAYALMASATIRRLVRMMQQEGAQAPAPQPAITGIDKDQLTLALDNLPPLVQDVQPQYECSYDAMLARTLVKRWEAAYGLDRRVPTHVLLGGFQSDDPARRRVAEIIANLCSQEVAANNLSSRAKGSLIERGLDAINKHLDARIIFPVHDNGRFFVLSSRYSQKAPQPDSLTCGRTGL